MLRSLLALAPLALVVLTGGCERNVGQLTVKLLKSAVAADDPLAKALVASLRFRVDGPSGRTGPITLPRDGSGALPGIPTGDDQIVTVEGVLSDVTKSRARSAPLTIHDGDNTIELFMGIVGQFSRAPARRADGKGDGGLITPRAFHTTTLLGDGRLLVVGGAEPTWRPESGQTLTAIASAERAHQDALRFSAVECPPGACFARALHTATRLRDGTVLIAGGLQQGAAVSQLQTYIPDQGFFAPGLLGTAFAEHAAVLVDDAAVLVGGQGGTSGSAALTGVFNVTAGGLVERQPGLQHARRAHALIRLDDGRLVAIGGFDSRGSALASIEVYEPGSSRWTDGPSLNAARAYLRVARLGDGYIIAGGLGPNGDAVSTIERLRLVGDELKIDEIGDLTTAATNPVWAHTATTVDETHVLVIGGFAKNVRGAPTNQVVELQLLESGAVQVTPSRPLFQRRAGHTATLLGSGNVVVIGGVGPPDSETVEIYVPPSS